MQQRRVLIQARSLVQECFGIAVRVKLDRAGRDHAGQTGAEAAEEAAPALGVLDGVEDVERLVDVAEGGAVVMELWGTGRAMRRGLSSVEVGLQPRSQDVEGRSEHWQWPSLPLLIEPCQQRDRLPGWGMPTRRQQDTKICRRHSCGPGETLRCGQRAL